MAADVAELVQRFGPFAAFGVAIVDRSGLPLLIGSVCVAIGAVGGSPTATLAFATAGMLAGDVGLFEIGRRAGATRALTRRVLRPLRPLRATARAIVLKYPYASLAFGRYVAGAGILLPMLAGSAGMGRVRAYLILAAGTLAYVIPWGALAFALGRGFEASMKSAGPLIGWAALAGLAMAAAAFIVFRVKRRARRAAAHLDHRRRRPSAAPRTPGQSTMM